MCHNLRKILGISQDLDFEVFQANQRLVWAQGEKERELAASFCCFSQYDEVSYHGDTQGKEANAMMNKHTNLIYLTLTSTHLFYWLPIWDWATWPQAIDQFLREVRKTNNIPKWKTVGWSHKMTTLCLVIIYGLQETGFFFSF